MQHILGLVRRCVEDYHMIEPGDRIAVGVSGGKDSLLTLVALARLRQFYPVPFTVEAITLEMGMPGMDFSPVAELCRELEVPYHRVSVPVYQIVFEERREKNPCSLCAKLRRGSLNTALTERGVAKIALGHHSDDAVETLLMNLLPRKERAVRKGPFGRCAAPLWYEGSVREAILAFKFKGKTGGLDCFGQLMAQCAAEEFSGEFDAVTWVPVSARRLYGRGPYKDHLWFAVRTGDADWTGRPTFYFEISPEYYSYGMGFWAAEPELMARYRRNIMEKPEELAALVRRLQRQGHFELTGPAYVKSKGDVGPLLQPWMQKKSVNLEHTTALDEKIFEPALADQVIEQLKELIPFYRYFAALCAQVYRERTGESDT